MKGCLGGVRSRRVVTASESCNDVESGGWYSRPRAWCSRYRRRAALQESKPADEGEAGGFRGLDGRRSKNGTVGGKVPGGVVTAGGGMGPERVVGSGPRLLAAS